MVYHGDDTKQRLTTLNRLTALDPIKVEQDLLMAHSRLASLPAFATKKDDDFQFKERQTRLNQFLQFCTNEELLLSDVDHILKQFVFECMSINTAEKAENPSQQTPRPSSADSHRHDVHLHIERQLSTINDDDAKRTNNSQPIIWDDPFEVLVINEQTGRIGIASDGQLLSPTSRSKNKDMYMKKSEELFFCLF